MDMWEMLLTNKWQLGVERLPKDSENTTQNGVAFDSYYVNDRHFFPFPVNSKLNNELFERIFFNK